MAGRNVPAGAHFSRGTGAKMRCVKGGAAGNLTVSTISLGDSILWITGICKYSANLLIATCVDFTSEFSVTAANTINNTGGTATTNWILSVGWDDATPN